MDKLKNAVLSLDVNNDAHWTKEGLPNTNYLKIVSATPSLTREMIEQVAPGFTRQKAQQDLSDKSADNSQVVKTGAVFEGAKVVTPEVPLQPVAPPTATTEPVTEGESNEGYANAEEERLALQAEKWEIEKQIAKLTEDKVNVVKRLDELAIAKSQQPTSMTQMIQLMQKQALRTEGKQERTIVEQKLPIDRPKAK